MLLFTRGNAWLCSVHLKLTHFQSASSLNYDLPEYMIFKKNLVEFPCPINSIFDSHVPESFTYIHFSAEDVTTIKRKETN